jgi:hypothetical protein
VEQILRKHEEGATLKWQAVLFRASQHSGALEVELTHWNIPYMKFTGLVFLDAAHLTDVLAASSLGHHPTGPGRCLPGDAIETECWVRSRWDGDWILPQRTLLRFWSSPRRHHRPGAGDGWKGFMAKVERFVGYVSLFLGRKNVLAQTTCGV